MGSAKKRKSKRKSSVFSIQKSKRMKKKLKKKGKAVNEEVSESFIQALQSTTVDKSKKSPLSKSEGGFIEELVKSHGTDYAGMARDKRNYNQLTEGELRRKCSLLKL